MQAKVIAATLITIFIIVIASLMVIPASAVTGKPEYVCDLTITIDYWFHRRALWAGGDYVDSIKVDFIENWREKKILELAYYPPQLLFISQEVTIRWKIEVEEWECRK